MLAYHIYHKLRERWISLHTRMAAKTLGAYGGGGRIESPVTFANPERLFIGRDVIICAGSMISCVTEWGNHQGYEGEIHIGDGVEIRENVQISAITKLIIGDYVGIARNCLISDHTHSNRGPGTNLMEGGLTGPKPVVIEDNCFIGANVMISPGVRIGHHSTVGFGSLVTKSVPPCTVVMGSPARVISRFDVDSGQWVISRRKL